MINTSNEMYIALYDYLQDKGIKLIVPNAHAHYGYEADILYLTNSDYLNEIEIKVSLSDTKADLKKRHTHNSPEIRNVWFAIPIELYEKAKEFIPVDYGILVVDRTESKYKDNNGKYLQYKYYVNEVRKPKTRMKVEKITLEHKYNLARIGSLKILYKQRRDLELEGYYNTKVYEEEK